MIWLQFVAAALFGGYIMASAGAPPETVIAGVTLAGGVTFIRQLLSRK